MIRTGWVPIVLDPDDFMVLVSGDPLRTNATTFAHNGYLGFPTAKKIVPPGTGSSGSAQGRSHDSLTMTEGYSMPRFNAETALIAIELQQLVSGVRP